MDVRGGGNRTKEKKGPMPRNNKTDPFFFFFFEIKLKEKCKHFSGLKRKENVKNLTPKVPKIQVSLKGVPFSTRGIGGRKLG